MKKIIAFITPMAKPSTGICETYIHAKSKMCQMKPF